MSKRRNLAGQTFGRLTPTEKWETRGKHRYWWCRCSCGSEKWVNQLAMTQGRTRSCGCLASELTRKRNTTHGMTYTKEFCAWQSMKRRCTNPSFIEWHRYGGRGISFAPEWDKFENFYDDMGPAPNGTSLDRIDLDGDYTSDNCRWATKKQQSRNTSTNHMITVNGETMCLVDWARRIGISHATIITRLNRGWSEERAVLTPSTRPQLSKPF